MYSTFFDHYKSSYTGAVFKFTPRDRESQRAALSQLNDHNQEFKQAMESRLGRPVTTRDLLDYQPPDERTNAQRVEQDAVVQVSEPRDPDKNPYVQTIADLEKKLQSPMLPGDRASTQRFLKQWKTASSEFEKTRAAEREAAAKHEASASQRAHAGASLVLLQMRKDVPEAWITKAKTLRDMAQTDPDAYWQAVREFQIEQGTGTPPDAA